MVAEDGRTTITVRAVPAVPAVAEIAERCGPIDVAVLFVSAARVPVRQNGRLLTLNSARAAAAAEVLRAKFVVPAHADGWAHFTQGVEDVRRDFEDAGISHVLGLAPMGSWNVPAA